MKRVLIPLADGFEEIETATIVDVLRRAGIEVVTAGVKPGALAGAHNMRLVPDVLLDEVKEEDFDMIVLPGGQPGVDNLNQDERVQAILKAMQSKQKMIGAICAAPLILQKAGLTQGLTFTSYPGIADQVKNETYRDASVVVDGKIITSRGPGTAMEFSLKLVELLAGKAKAEELSGAMLVEIKIT